MSETSGGKRNQLGRGLSALLGNESNDYAELDRVRAGKNVPIEFLRPGRFQPRHRFDAGEINALAASITKNGILQPILVRRLPEEPNAFEIIAGERRWRAAQQAKLYEVPVVIRDFSDKEALEVALVEKLQRQDLSPIEEGAGYRRLLEEFGYTQTDLADSLGKSRSHVANTIRLLDLPDAVRMLVDEGKLSAGHARALLAAREPVRLAEQVVREGMSVRQVERLVQKEKSAANGGAGKRTTRAPATKDADTLALERDLSALLGLKVSIAFDGKGGTLTIQYKTVDQLDDVLKRLNAR